VARARDRAQAAGTRWRGRAEWSVVDGADGWRGESPTGLWAYDTLSARLNPRRALAGLAAAVRALGGEITQGVGWRPDGAVRGPVIWATGAAGLADLSADLGRSVGAGQKGQAALLACAAGHQPQLYVDGLHIVPHADGTVAVGSTSERDWQEGWSTDGQLEQLIARARAASPALAAAPVVDRWAGVRPRAESRLPLLGAWPGRQGHFVANGGFKIGFGLAPKVATVMAELVLEGRDHIPKGFKVMGGP
jgi:glycine oxidase